MFAQKKPRVWPRFFLGFQGNFPSFSDSKREVARRFASYLAGQKVKLASAWIVVVVVVVNQRQACCVHIIWDEELWEEGADNYSLSLNCDPAAPKSLGLS